MKIYTKTGDQGTSSLYGGKRLSKASLHMAAYGSVDELNSILGMVIAHRPAQSLVENLHQIQADLLTIGSDLATPLDVHGKLKVVRIGELAVDRLEGEIDAFTEHLPELRHFIYPSGSIIGSQLHLARAMCRRAERHCVALAEEEKINQTVLIYLNRLSDWLFTMARYQNQNDNSPEREWIP